jgi:hypothetical protein
LAEKRHQESQVPYTSSSIALDPLFYNHVPLPRPFFSQSINSAGTGSGEPIVDLDMYMMDPIIPVYMDPILNDPKDKIEQLRRERSTTFGFRQRSLMSLVLRCLRMM